LNLAVTDRPINKPTKISHLKFPGRAFSLSLHGTSPYHPTRSALLTTEFLRNQKIKELTFNMDWDVSPALFEALYGFKRSPQ
jgi:hypothetical protein